MAINIAATPHIIMTGDFNFSAPVIDKIGRKSVKI